MVDVSCSLFQTKTQRRGTGGTTDYTTRKCEGERKRESERESRGHGPTQSDIF